MARSTGPIVGLTLITYGNAVVLNGQSPVDRLPILVGGAIAGGALFLVEQWSPRVAVGVAWVALVTVLFTRVDKDVPSPVESLQTWLRKA